MAQPFSFSERRGFPLVIDKVAEADFFLDKMTEERGLSFSFKFYFSAFLSAARSVTFALQYVMSGYPGFDAWYAQWVERLKQDDLAKFFVSLRNEDQKRGIRPVSSMAYMKDGIVYAINEFVSTPLSDIKQFPDGDICHLAQRYMRSLVEVVGNCYRDFDAYVDPRLLYCKDGLSELNWSIEDLEEYMGFPRGFTDIPGDWPDKDGERLRLLRRNGFDEGFEAFIEKYGIDVRPARNP